MAAVHHAVDFTAAKKYTIEYRATDRKDNVSAVKTAAFEVLAINDSTAPTATAATAGNQDQRSYFIGSSTLTLTATDDATGSGIDKIEYRVNGGAYTLYTAPVAFNAVGNYDVDYRATDKVGNVSTVKTISFRILSGAGCTSARSDEFDGAALGSQWQRHTRNGGTPLSALTFSGGQLHMPTADFELDAANTTTSVGPVNFIGQDLAALGTNWTAETEFTVKYTGGWQNTGMIIYNGDNNFVRTSITHSLTAGNLYVEQSKDNPTTTEGARVQAGSTSRSLPNHDQAVTIRMRMARVNASNTVTAQYRVMAPASVAMADWANFGGTAGFVDLNPSGGARRDAAGSRIGIITASNFPGTTGAFAYAGTPGTVDVNYFRVTPDPLTCETTAPATTATLEPAAPATGDTYDRAVKVNLSAADTGTSAAGVDKTEYRITTNGVAGDWKTFTNTAGDAPFVNTVNVAQSGTHLVEFRSTDKAANTGDDQVGHLQGPAAGVRPLGRVRRHGHPAALDPSHAQRRHAHHGPARADGLRRPAAPADEQPRDRRRRRQHLGRPDQLPRPGPARTGHELDRGDAVHRPDDGRLAERRPGRVAGRQQLLPLHDHPQPGLLGDLRRAVQGRPDLDRGCAHRRRELEHPADQHRSGDDQDALHAPQRLQHRDVAVPDRRPGLRGDRRLGQLPDRHGRSGSGPQRRRPS